MHAAIQLLAYWLLALVDLGVALLLLSIYCSWVGNDLELLSAASEVVIAAIASLIEGASLWLVVRFIPHASRALLFPAVIVALIYKIAHLEDWGRFEIFALILFQAAIGFFGVALFFGHFEQAAAVLGVFGAVLFVVGSLLRSLWD